MYIRSSLIPKHAASWRRANVLCNADTTPGAFDHAAHSRYRPPDNSRKGHMWLDIWKFRCFSAVGVDGQESQGRGLRATDYPLTCHAGQTCGTDHRNRIVGCCWTLPGGGCVVSTTCLDGPGVDDLESARKDLEVVCYGDVSPYCKTDVFADDASLEGYSLFICADDRITETVLRYITTVATTSSVLSTTTHSQRVSPSAAPSKTQPASTLSSSIAKTPDAPIPSTAPPPAWGIAGTVLGGTGALTLLIVCYLMYRKWRKRFKINIQRRHAAEPSRQEEARPIYSQAEPHTAREPGALREQSTTAGA